MITETHRSQVLSAQESQRPLLIKSHTYLAASQRYVDKLLAVFLAELGLPSLTEPLSFCLRELGVNAKKANVKRLYFARRGLDPRNPAQYETAMRSFKKDTIDHQQAFLRELKDRDLWVKFEFLRRPGLCSLAVRNNAEALPAEVARVRDKTGRAGRFQFVEDAFGEVLDESEGAGLGIVVVVLMLRNLGFPDESFQFYTVPGETVARIILPVTLD